MPDKIVKKPSKTSSYDSSQVEPKWLEYWEQEQLFQGVDLSQVVKPEDKMYLLFAFAYPSGSGLHVGHVESITALDIMARYYRMQGKQVFFPVGWDAFGLPAENYAIKTGIAPDLTTKKAIDTFRRQVKRVAISYDWQTELATCHPGYYQWTQWLFAQLYQHGLAYKDQGMVNWCPSCQTVLANEQVVEGSCERCDEQVVQKELEQWYFKITDYQDELIEGLDKVDWPEATKQQQINWIGRSQGVEVDFQLKQTGDKLTCFTTRIDTIYGATFLVISPEKMREMKLLQAVAKIDGLGEGGEASKSATTSTQTSHFEQVEQYLVKAFEKTEEERRIGEKDKTGVNTGLTAINPVNQQEIPIFVADYVLAGVGTGIVMGVPAHDERDFEFAQKHQLPVVATNQPAGIDLEQVRQQKGVQAAQELIDQVRAGEQVWSKSGIMINSDQFDGLDWKEAQAAILEEFSDQMRPTTNYKLRDWLISRQRYWGAPIPVIYDPDCQPHLIKDQDLPWKLPEDVDFKPTGESPLRSSKELRQRTEKYAAQKFQQLIEEKGWDKSGQGWKPEFDTMDTFVDSSWYYLRYLDPRNQEEFASSYKLNNWLPVDFYLIGPEHIVLHLLYSRFFTKFLRDHGYLELETGEPFAKMRHQGMILGPDHKKMSKSKGNVINPDEIVDKYGADTLRVYEMFMGPLDADKAWDDRAVQGVRRFLEKVYHLVWQAVEAETRGQDGQQEGGQGQKDQVWTTESELETKLHQTIKKVTADIPQLKFNTAIAAMMELTNLWRSLIEKNNSTDRSGGLTHPMSLSDVRAFVRLLAPFAPFLAEELWYQLGETASVHQQPWPEFDPEIAREDEVVIPVQVNGKLRGELVLSADELEELSQAQVIERAKQLESVQKWLIKTRVDDRQSQKAKQPAKQLSKLKKEIYVPGRIVSLVV
ncbi:MAG: leucine--tRNA ligase [Candidatus Pacebacteria bacterium]|nr:leucine--tRNA ligase [Candidatus Paceibacterota bacterium]